jgi:hypothetical protein
VNARNPSKRITQALTWSLLLFFFSPAPLFAHVGSPDVYYEGDAGPYHLYVTVRLPQVIPGIAEIQVRSRSNDISRVRLVPMMLTGPGSSLLPKPDSAEQSKQDPNFFSGSLWLMQSGALQVRITVDGSKGQADLSVPVASFAQRTLPMPKPLAAVLIFLMVFLAFGLVSIVEASVRQGSLEPGQVPTTSSLRRSRWFVTVAALVIVALLYMGKLWWDAEAKHYQRGVDFFKPPQAEVTLEANRMLIRAKDQQHKWNHHVKLQSLLPDHNHLMHLFLVRVPQLDRMWHLHPDLLEGKEGVFAQDLPSMPAGRYQLFGDVVDKNGFPWTLVTQVDLPEIRNGKPLAGDDSFWSGTPLDSGSRDSTTCELADGGRMVWQREAAGPIRANTAMSLKFEVFAADGKPVTDIEPYMGMAGHAELVRSDLAVFAHIHPAGSVSMPALELAQLGLAGQRTGAQDAMPGMKMSTSSTPLSSEISFPYGFPAPGEYRIFVQVKRSGHVETAVFDTRVQ